EDQSSIASKQTAASGGLEFLPDLVGAQHQGHEFAALADGLASDAGIAVGRALIVRRMEAVDANRARPQLGGLIQRGAADGPLTDHQNIRNVGHRRHDRARNYASSKRRET